MDSNEGSIPITQAQILRWKFLSVYNILFNCSINCFHLGYCRFGQFLVATIPDHQFNERSLVVDNPASNGGYYIIVESKKLRALV